ncbi:MAG: aminotransferase class V-fold PLP-dependent enzyme [Parvularculaceae bacterium]|nr:aminotransferase class V-fold PLP-dependent enzyme [Parvularculaceae bacterium]
MRSPADIDRLDAEDPLRQARAAFALPDGVIYLDGNSLGPPTKKALTRLRATAEQEWGEGLIRSWNDAGWFDLPQTCGAKIARLIGVDPGDVLVCDSVSVNLFKLAAALKNATPGARLVIDRAEFPTDVYMIESLAALLGPGDGPPILIKSAIDFRTAAIADIDRIEGRTRAQGGVVVWDLSHAAGLLDLRLKARGARCAVGCGYKFLNGGPGAPAFVYVERALADTLRQPLAGWMGHARPFDFRPDYAPAPGVRRFAAGTPQILSLAALDAALDAFDGASMPDVETKARRLGDLFLEGVAALGLPCLSPPSASRGGHVSLSHPQGYSVMQALIARGVIGDFRPPDLMRFGFSPLFLRYADAARAASILEDVLRSEQWRAPHFADRRTVT